MKANIERRTVNVPAECLPAGTYFRYKMESREESDDKTSGILLCTNVQGKAVNLYCGSLVPILDLPYEIINDVEIKGWV